MRRAPVDTLATLLGSHGPGSVIVLPEATAHYLEDVLRLAEGELVELFDGAGLVVRARLSEERAHAEVVEIDHVMAEGRQIVLCQAMPKGERWEWLLEKSTELGVHAIYPVRSARTVVKIAPAKQAKKLVRWRQIIESAARQSGRALTPSVHEQDSLQSTIAQVMSKHPGCLHLVAALHHDTQKPGQALSDLTQDTPVCVWVGPEGGWTGEELEALDAHGARFMSLGPRVLRAETAALSAITLAQHLVGDWA